MPIRITGMNSGLDTEALVSELVSAYRKKGEKNEKAQKKLSWKQEAWKNLNTKISSFYSSLTSLKFSNAYNIKKAVISDSTKATVSAGNGAVPGSYSLKVNNVASAGYLTGGKLDDSVTANSTLGSLGYSGGNGTISVTTGGEKVDISVSSSTTISEFVTSLNKAGVKASFDSTNHRLYVAASKTGKDNDFTLTGGNAAGTAALSKLGLSLKSEANMDEYKKWASFARNSDGNAYITGYDADGKAITNGVYDAGKTKDYIKTESGKLGDYSAAVTNKIEEYQYLQAFKQMKIEKLNGTMGSQSYIDAQKIVDQYESDSDNNDEATLAKNTYQNAYDAAKNAGKTDDEAMQAGITAIMGHQEDVKTGIKEAQDNLEKFNDLKGASEYDTTLDFLAEKITNATGVVDGSNTLEFTPDAVKIAGQDAEIELNGVTYTSANSDVTVNGLTVSALAKTTNAVTVTVANDTQGMYDKVKNVIKEYNTLINEMTSLYNADSAKGYEPLTSEEKEALSDSEVEEWEKKIKDSLLRRDDTLNSLISSMTSVMYKSFEINGKNYSLSSFGIQTLGVLNAKDNEENAFHIAGDSEDSASSGKTDMLMAALQENPEVVAEFMQKLAGGLYDTLNSRMSSSTLSSYGVVYNDKEMAQEYSDYTETISKWEKKLEDIEESYYKKFAAMESALATLQAQQSSLASMLGF